MFIRDLRVVDSDNIILVDLDTEMTRINVEFCKNLQKLEIICRFPDSWITFANIPKHCGNGVNNKTSVENAN